MWLLGNFWLRDAAENLSPSRAAPTSAELTTEGLLWVQRPNNEKIFLTIDRFTYFLSKDCSRCHWSPPETSLQLQTVPLPHLRQLHPSPLLHFWRYCSGNWYNLDMLSNQGWRRFGETHWDGFGGGKTLQAGEEDGVWSWWVPNDWLKHLNFILYPEWSH